jgi:hypothetical protein
MLTLGWRIPHLFPQGVVSVEASFPEHFSTNSRHLAAPFDRFRLDTAAVGDTAVAVETVAAVDTAVAVETVAVAFLPRAWLFGLQVRESD